MKTNLGFVGLVVCICLSTPLFECAAGFQAGIRGGYFLASGWSDTHDLIYDSAGTYAIGAEIGYGFFFPMDLVLSVDFLSADGERVWPNESGGFESTGESVSYDMIPISLAARWHFLLENTFSPYIGIGVSYVQFSETDEETIDGTGLLIQAGSDVYLSRFFRFFVEADWRSYPDTIGDLGASYYFNETDLGGITGRIGLRVVF